MSDNACPCGQPASDTTICPACVERLSRALGDVTALAHELQTVLSKQTKAGGSHVGYVRSSPTRPLPYDPKASEVGGALKAVLVSWTRLVLEEATVRPPLPADSLAGLSRFLLSAVPFLRLHDAAGDAVDEITYAVEQVRRVTMREAVERHYRGPCREEWMPDGESPATCLADLYARGLHASSVTCSQCGTRHDSLERRDWLLGLADDRLLSQAELVVLFKTILDRPISQSTIASWVRRKHLVPRTVVRENDRDVALYRISDVTALVGSPNKKDAA